MKERYPEITDNLARNPLPPAYEVIPVDGDRVQEVAAALEPLPAGVREGDVRREEGRARAPGGDHHRGHLPGRRVILLIASTILIANTIRLSIFSRRREIEVMKLVGATNWFVRAPFMLEGIVCGLAGSIVAVVLLLLAKELALPGIWVASRARTTSRPGASRLVAIILVCVSLLVGAVGSGITMRRFLRV